MKNKKWAGLGRKLLPLLAAVVLASALPVTAGAAAPPSSGTLTIHKYALADMAGVGLPGDGNPAASLPADAEPLAGVEYTVWQVDPGAVSGISTPAQAWPHILTSTVQTGVTGAAGEVVFTLGSGLYYVAETNSASRQDIVFSDPFLVSMPMADPATGGWITDVHAYPKSQALVIDKFVGDPGGADYDFTDSAACNSRPVSVGEEFGWSILSGLPAGLSTANPESYTVTDNLDIHFDYIPGSVTAYSVPAMTTPAAAGYPLTEGTDYTLQFNASTNTLVLRLTGTGMTLVGGRYTSDSDRFLLIKFDCRINGAAQGCTRLCGTATVSYAKNVTAGIRTARSGGVSTLAAGDGSRSVATASVSADRQPAVHTGRIEVTKMEDGTSHRLAGAVFGIASNQADAVAGNFLATGTTGADGTLVLSGFSYGAPGDQPNQNSTGTTFWMAETQAPDGYKRIPDLVEVTFNYGQNDAGDYFFSRFTVYNVASGAGSTTASPKTGDERRPFLYLGLLALSLAAGTLLVRRLKQRPMGAGRNPPF